MAPSLTIATIDLAVVIIYLSVVFSIGLFLHRQAKTDLDFALAGRKLPSTFVGFSAFASWVGLAGTFGTPENVYKFGLSGTWWFMAWLPGVLLMAYFLAARLRKRLYMTVPELLGSKSSANIGIVASLVTSWNYLAWAAVQVFALSLIFNTFMHINSKTGAFVAFLVVVIYTLVGGLRAVVFTDMVQAVMILCIIMVVAPATVLIKGTGLEQIYQKTRDIPQFFTLFKGAGGKTLLTWFFGLVPAAFIDPGGLQRVFAARDPGAAKRGLLLSALLYFLFGVAITFLGVAARATLPGIDATKALPFLLSQFLPVGLTGLAIAGLLAIAMSTADTALLVVITTLQRDIYARLRPDISDKERLIVDRVLTVALGGIALLIALEGKSVVSILLLGFSIYVPGLLLPVLAASFDWRLPNWAMLGTIVAGSVSAGVWVFLGEPFFPAIVLGLAASCIPFFSGLRMRSNRNLSSNSLVWGAWKPSRYSLKSTLKSGRSLQPAFRLIRS